jgi:hypothetical protein
LILGRYANFRDHITSEAASIYCGVAIIIGDSRHKTPNAYNSRHVQPTL